ncbi:DUF981 family protein [Polymorphospora sp. NPDC050346]|uniref:DUF981 family protein n=1 Tax=Polymorphospora sp. NPDC050346 TaxID=3155780 RepID=UPI0033CD66F1
MNTLIMYNTTIGLAAGLALLLVPRFWAVATGAKAPLLLMPRNALSRSGWVAAFGALALVLYPLALISAVVHPLHSEKSWIDTIFSEPSLILASVLVAATWWLARAGRPAAGEDDVVDTNRMRGAMVPVTWIIFWLGIVLVFCAAAIVRFEAVGGAPAEEPITGRFGHLPALENLFFGLGLYGLAALGCLAFPAAVRGRAVAWQIVYWSWTLAGLGFAIFSALNFYTHTGLLINFDNLQNDPGFEIYRW